MKPEVSKVKAAANFPEPVFKKDVRSFLGLMGYYRKFIPQYATLGRKVQTGLSRLTSVQVHSRPSRRFSVRLQCYRTLISI